VFGRLGSRSDMAQAPDKVYLTKKRHNLANGSLRQRE